MLGGIELAPLVTRIKVDIGGFKSDMDKAKVAGVAAAKDMSTKLSGVANVGKSMSKIGATLTKTVTLPIIAAGTASVKFAMDAEQSFAKTGTIIDKTAVPVDKLRKDVIKASNETGIAVTDFNEALYQSVSAGVDSGNAISFTADMTKLAKGGFTSTEKAVDVVTSALNAYGLEANQATSVSDKLITTQNLGKTTVDALSTSLGKIIPTAKGVNMDIDNVCTGMAQLTKNGIQTAEATTYFNSMLNELGKSGSTADETLKKVAKKGFAQLVKEGKPVTEILTILEKEAKKSGKSLADMFGSAEAAKAAQTIMKDGGIEYNQILGDMKNSAGATQKAFEQMDVTPMEQMKKAMNQLRNAAIEIGAKLIPVVVKIADKIKQLAERFSNMSPQQQDFIVKLGLMVAAIGPVLSIGGNVITTYTKWAPLFAKISAVVAKAGGAAALFGKAIAVLSGPVGWVIGGIAAFTAGGIALYKHFKQELVPAVDLFADSTGECAVKISEETKNAVGSYMEMDDKITKTLYDMRINNTTVTEEMAQEMTGSIENMATSIQDKMEENTKKTTESVSKLFQESGGIIDAEEQSILDSMVKHNEEKSKQVDFYSQQINSIYAKAADEHRSLTSEEHAEISNIQAQMRDTAITELSATEEEAAVIRQRMKDYQGRLSVEMASETIQSAAQARDGQISAANEAYDGVVREAAKLKNAGAINDEQYNTMIQKAQENRDSQINNANETYNGIVTEIQNATPGIENSVDLQNGKILTKWDQFKANFSKKWTEITNAADEGMKNIGKRIGDGLTKIERSINNGVTNAVNWVKQKASEFFSHISQWFFNIINKVKEWMGNIVSRIKEKAGDMWNAGTTVFNRLWEGLKSIWDRIVSWFKGVVEDPVGAIKGIGEKLWNAGWDILQRLWDGLKAKWGSVSSWVGQKASEISSKLNPKNWFNGGGEDGYLYNGLSYVPFDGYNATLHKGERVLTSEENRRYTQGDGNNSGGDTFYFYSPKAIDAREAARQLRRANRLRRVRAT